jgi:hypothetical protein
MWEPRRHTALWAFTACYRDSFTFDCVSYRNGCLCRADWQQVVLGRYKFESRSEIQSEPPPPQVNARVLSKTQEQELQLTPNITHE